MSSIENYNGRVETSLPLPGSSVSEPIVPMVTLCLLTGSRCLDLYDRERHQDTGWPWWYGHGVMGRRIGGRGGKTICISQVHNLSRLLTSRIQKVAESLKDEFHFIPACGLGLGQVAWQSRVLSSHSLPLVPGLREAESRLMGRLPLLLLVSDWPKICRCSLLNRKMFAYQFSY